jgi:predicted dehydrogenase
MGMIHYHAYQKVKGAKVVAIVSRSPEKRSGDWRGIKGNFGPEGDKIDLGDIARYETLDQLLKGEDVDLVDICLPQTMHADASTGAMLAGKHVLCEKPISITTRDADQMVKTAHQTQKKLMIGQVLPFFPEYKYAKRLIDEGTHGQLTGGYFKRVMSDPTWISDYYDPEKSGGPLIDLHIHDAHFIRLLCGMPDRVFSRGRMRGEVVDFATTQFIFNGENNHLITSTCGVISQQGRPFTHAFEIYLEKATLIYDFSNFEGKGYGHTPLTLVTDDGKVVQPETGTGDPIDAFVAELSHCIETVTTGSPSPMLDGSVARDALLLCHREVESVRTGKIVKV